MTSVAGDLRRLQHDRLAAMTPAERVELALRLGERDLDLFCAVQQLPRAAARRLLARTRRLGRCPSPLMDREDR
jgi:hypothetical protein